MLARPGAGVQIASLTKTLGTTMAPVPILRGLHLQIAPGEFIAVTGASGSGKSTLLHIIAGLDSATTGSVHIDGVDLAGMDDDQRALFRRDHVGLIFQSFHLLDILTAEENVAMPLALARVSSAESSRRAAEMLEALGLGHRRHHRPDQLSGGEQQRVAIARALVGNPKLLLADEPTGNLDSTSRTLVMGLLRDVVRQLGVTLLMVTHDPTCAALADREVRMRDGQWEDRAPTVPRAIPAARAV